MKKKNTSIYLYAYYTILLILLISRQNATSEPPMVLRLAFIAAAILPTLFNRKISYPAIITLFYTTSMEGFAYSFMPYTLSLYVIITLVVVMVRKVGIISFPKFLLIFTLYIFLIDLFFSVSQFGANLFQGTFYCFVLIGLFIAIVDTDYKINLMQLSLCFAVTTVVLSYAFLTHRESFILDTFQDMERSGWADPNYFGMIIGMGTIIGLIKFFNKEWLKANLVEKTMYFLAVFMSLPVLALNASRGAALSVTVAFIALIIVSKTKKIYKILIIFVAVLAVGYLYSNDYFAIMQYRIENDDGTGSNRTDVWTNKLTAFVNGNPMKIIIGYGHQGGSTINGGSAIGFHNDYIGFLVDYGLIGLVLLLYMIFYPIKTAPKGSKDKPYVIVLVCYFVVCLLTLEPLLLGNFSYFLFYMYILLMAKNSKLLNVSNSQISKSE